MQKNNNLELFSAPNASYFTTGLPTTILNEIIQQCEQLRPHATPTKILTKQGIQHDKSFRDNVSVAIPVWNWFAGMIWHYIMRVCLLYTSPSPRDLSTSRMPSSA